MKSVQWKKICHQTADQCYFNDNIIGCDTYSAVYFSECIGEIFIGRVGSTWLIVSK